MATTYEIANDIKSLYALVESLTDPETGETREPTEEELETFLAWAAESAAAFTAKADGICRAYKNLDLEAGKAEAVKKTFAEEVSRLLRTQRARENEAARVKGLLVYAMQKLDMRKLKTELFSVYFAATKKTARPNMFFDVDKIPAEYLKRELSASAIGDAVREGRLYEKPDPLDRGKLFYTDEGGTERALAGVSWLGGETLVIR